MASTYHLYLVRATLPSGDVGIAIKTITYPKVEWEVEKLHGEIARAVGQNPDVVVDWNSVKYIGSQDDPAISAKYDEAMVELRKSFVDPEKGEGIDKLNLLLADPSLSRKRAVDKQSRTETPSEV